MKFRTTTNAAAHSRFDAFETVAVLNEDCFLIEFDETQSLERLRRLPIWVAHSADDETVPIAYDDACVEALRALSAPVTYTRVDGYGHHRLCDYFYTHEAWVSWMFSQRRDDGVR